MDYRLLPAGKTFRELLFPFLIPYLVYVGVGSFPEELLSPAWNQILKSVLVGSVLWHFRKQYRIGPLKSRHLWVSLAAAPFLAGQWCLLLYATLAALPGAESAAPAAVDATSGNFSWSYWILRTLNSVILVALFEELLCRAYLMELFFDLEKEKGHGLGERILQRFDGTPRALGQLPLSAFSVGAATVFFTVGHGVEAYPAAIAYFLATCWLYWKTQSLWVCILSHGLVNLSIALLVQFASWDFLW